LPCQVFQKEHTQILGKVMDLNCFTWIFNLGLAKQQCFIHSFPPTHPLYTSFYCACNWIIRLVQGGCDMVYTS
jgi:hypothetical protein